MDIPQPALHDGRPLLTACIITLNEGDRIGDCLASVAFCDEVVVVDSGSTDETVVIAMAMGARVVTRAFEGYRSQKDFAVSQASHDWILSLDADERVSDRLRVDIEAVRDGRFAGASGYRFPRLSQYFGKFLRHGNAYPDRHLRLFDRRKAGFRGVREIHEAVTAEGRVVDLQGDLVHYPYRSLEQQLSKTQAYARMMAEYDHARGKQASVLKLVLAPAWRFWRGYVLRLGFLDGWQGLVYAYVRANYVRQKSIMLLMLQRQQPVTSNRN